MTLFRKFALAFWVLALPALVFAQKKDVTLEEIWSFRFYPFPAEDIQWMKNDAFYSSLSDDKGLMKIPIDKPEKAETLIDPKALVDGGGKPLKMGDYKFNKDETKVLFTTDHKKIYRHSFTAVTYVYDLKAGKMTPVFDGKRIQLPTFSPDGTKLGFVFENNLYCTDLTTGQTQPITQDGALNNIINGTTDWVYEEEFGFTQGFHFSPDSKLMAFYRLDESAVPQFTMDKYGKLYPDRQTFKYPKAGEKNAVVEIHIHDLAAGKAVKVDLGRETDQYVPRIFWTRAADKLAVLRLNRHQNKLDILFADSKTGATQTVLTEQSKTYVDVTDETVTFLEKTDQFLLLSEKDGFNHLYLYDYAGKEVRKVTQGAWEITKFYGLDEPNGLLYFQSTENGAIERQIYSISIESKGKKQISEGKGWHEATFSSAFSYMIDEFSNAATPPVTRLYTAKGKLVRVLMDNKNTLAAMQDKNVSPKEFIDFMTADGVKLNGWLIKPQNFDASKKYPLLMFCYGGPGHQEVTDSYDGFNFWWYQMLASKGYMVACVDNRGTGGRGAEFKKVTYQDLGKYETIDQIAAAKYFAGLPYVDAKRIGIWGWSFGGYLSSLCLAKGADVFKTAIAVAPVTNWRFYDTIYTERFLRTPQENPKGYDENSPINFAKNIKGNYLIVHGMADDNVHFQNAVEMTDALVKAGIDFEEMFYPNNNHGIFGPGARMHLYKKMTNFILTKL